MYLKNIVDEILKERARSLSWLALQMGKTFDGLKLSLIKESLKYKDIAEMAKILEVSPITFFQNEIPAPINGKEKAAPIRVDNDEKGNIKSYRELIAALRVQLKDNEKIIALISKVN